MNETAFILALIVALAYYYRVTRAARKAKKERDKGVDKNVNNCR